ncbi:unnamed protein product [Effrenium voratum]|nr:unnamed protein product [Effrenium voratum]
MASDCIDALPSFERASTARSSSASASTPRGAFGTPRGHERLMLRERDRKSCAEVPRLRLESDRSSSSGFTSRSELEPPPQSREVQDLCREMEAMRHVIQKDLAEMQGTWVQLKEAVAAAGGTCRERVLRRQVWNRSFEVSRLPSFHVMQRA